MLQLFGYISGILAIIEYIPYIQDILKKRTKPHRATFFIWSILGSIAFFSQLDNGASNSLWFTGIETGGILITFLLSIRYGVGGFSRMDKVGLCISFVGLLAWYFTKQAAVALYLTIFVDAIGSYLTVHKTFHMPQSETAIAWILSALSGIFAMLAVGKFDIILLSYPAYTVVANLCVVGAIVLGTRRSGGK